MYISDVRGSRTGRWIQYKKERILKHLVNVLSK